MTLYTRVGDLLLGYCGLALLRTRVVDLGGKAFCDARVADVRRILDHWDDEPRFKWEAYWEEVPSAEGYALLAKTYDTDPNPLIDLDNATLGPLLDRYPPGEALDAGCGTGRWTKYLWERGHKVQGVDESPEMLEVARAKLPSVEFSGGDVRQLPVGDASVDLLVCSLVLTYLPELIGPFSEFARVVRPGGHAVISNIHHLALMLGGTTKFHTPSGRSIRLPASLFLPTDYVMAGVRSGFKVHWCAEVPWLDVDGDPGSVAQDWCPEAARAASVGIPALVVVALERER